MNSENVKKFFSAAKILKHLRKLAIQKFHFPHLPRFSKSNFPLRFSSRLSSQTFARSRKEFELSHESFSYLQAQQQQQL